jgi:hypothetical protein
MSQEIKNKRGRKPLSQEFMAARNTEAIAKAKSYGLSISPDEQGNISRAQYYYIMRRINQIDADSQNPQVAQAQ